MSYPSTIEQLSSTVQEVSEFATSYGHTFVHFIGEHESSFISIATTLVTVYAAFYAIAWAKYEFHITRQSQQMSVLAALCSTEKRKEFAPALAELTRKKLPNHPTLFNPWIIASSLLQAPSDTKYLKINNQDTIQMVTKIILGFDDWKDADLHTINLSGAYLYEAQLNGANLSFADLRGSKLISANLSEAYLFAANLQATILIQADLRQAFLVGADLRGAFFLETDLRGAILNNANLLFFYYKDKLIQDSTTDKTLIKKCVALLSEVETLYQATLPTPVKAILQRDFPHLFDTPKYQKELYNSII